MAKPSSSNQNPKASESKSDLGEMNNNVNGSKISDLQRSDLGAYFRGVTAIARAKLPALKVASTQTVRTVASNRPLAFASEGAVAGKSIMPRYMYIGAWGLSGLAIVADITSKTWDAPLDKKWQTTLYYTSFHIPATLVIPAYVIHKVVDVAEHSVKNHSYAKNLPSRIRPLVPVGAALLSIIPVVPTVDYAAEAVMEPTLGKYLGLEFHHNHKGNSDKEKEA